MTAPLSNTDAARIREAEKMAERDLREMDCADFIRYMDALTKQRWEDITQAVRLGDYETVGITLLSALRNDRSEKNLLEM